MTSKEEHWQKCRELLEKRISELEDSHKEDKISNASAMQKINHGDIEERELFTEKYINVVYIVKSLAYREKKTGGGAMKKMKPKILSFYQS